MWEWQIARKALEDKYSVETSEDFSYMEECDGESFWFLVPDPIPETISDDIKSLFHNICIPDKMEWKPGWMAAVCWCGECEREAGGVIYTAEAAANELMRIASEVESRAGSCLERSNRTTKQ